MKRYAMSNLFKSDWFIPMLGGFALGGAYVFGASPLFSAIF
jgi:hypothetical protein